MKTTYKWETIHVNLQSGPPNKKM